MPSPRDLHAQAMELAAQADRARATGDATQSKSLLEAAFEMERDAAKEYASLLETEPTRAILHKSAAALAVELSLWREAEILIASALMGSPPEYVADELRNLLEDVYFSRHLLSEEIALAPNEIDLTVAGEAVGFGIADKDEVLPRLDALQTLLLRTAERVSNRTFRKKGRPATDVRNLVHLYMQAPRAASLGFKVRVGSPQPALPGLSLAEKAVADVLDGLRAIGSADDQSLTNLINDDDYRRNFTTVARELLPDGRRIKTVNIAGEVRGERTNISIVRTRKSVIHREGHSAGSSEEILEFVGELRLMDSTKQTEVAHIRIADGKDVAFIVPSEIMTEVLPGYYKHTVRLILRRRKWGKPQYVDVERVED